MPTEKEMKEARKAVAYDIIDILESQPKDKNYTLAELKQIIKAYVNTANQN